MRAHILALRCVALRNKDTKQALLDEPESFPPSFAFLHFFFFFFLISDFQTNSHLPLPFPKHLRKPITIHILCILHKISNSTGKPISKHLFNPGGQRNYRFTPKLLVNLGIFTGVIWGEKKLLESTVTSNLFRN